MKTPVFTKKEERALLTISVLGLLVPNGIFLYHVVTDFGKLTSALSNPVSLVFVIEAFFLMFFAAWLIRKAGLAKVSGKTFILLSLLGSMVFSLPATLYWEFKHGD